MSKIVIFSLFIIGTIIASMFYTLGSYYFRIGESRKIKFMYIYFISIFLGLLSYSIKIPIFYYFGKEMSVMIINAFFLIITFISVTLFSKFILKEEIPMHTYLILILIVLLIVLNDILDRSK